MFRQASRRKKLDEPTDAASRLSMQRLGSAQGFFGRPLKSKNASKKI
jgi:hypothetical protein